MVFSISFSGSLSLGLCHCCRYQGGPFDQVVLGFGHNGACDCCSIASLVAPTTTITVTHPALLLSPIDIIDGTRTSHCLYVLKAFTTSNTIVLHCVRASINPFAYPASPSHRGKLLRGSAKKEINQPPTKAICHRRSPGPPTATLPDRNNIDLYRRSHDERSANVSPQQSLDLSPIAHPSTLPTVKRGRARWREYTPATYNPQEQRRRSRRRDTPRRWTPQHPLAAACWAEARG